jgi:hypothetical protein
MPGSWTGGVNGTGHVEPLQISSQFRFRDILATFMRNYEEDSPTIPLQETGVPSLSLYTLRYLTSTLAIKLLRCRCCCPREVVPRLLIL